LVPGESKPLGLPVEHERLITGVRLLTLTLDAAEGEGKEKTNGEPPMREVVVEFRGKSLATAEQIVDDDKVEVEVFLTTT
jgi:hypothetical protein